MDRILKIRVYLRPNQLFFLFSFCWYNG